MKILTGLLLGMLWFAGVAWGGDFTVNPNGTVIDNVAGLMWQQEDDDIARNWEQALIYCEDFALDNFADWRLPNMKELESLTDKSTFNPAIDPIAFPDVAWSNYWSATTFAGNATSAWAVSFGSGVVFPFPKTIGYYVRCVRGGE